MNGVIEVYGERPVLGYRDSIAGDYWKVDFEHGFLKENISLGLNKRVQAVPAQKCVKMKEG